MTAAPQSRQARRAAARQHADRRPPFGVQTLDEQLAALHRQVADLSAQVIETRSGIAAEARRVFEAEYTAKFRELDELRNECARMLRRLVDSGRLTQSEVNEAAR